MLMLHRTGTEKKMGKDTAVKMFGYCIYVTVKEN